jgi:hypothetical protein
MANYSITKFGKTNVFTNIFETGTTTGTSNFKQGNVDLNTLFKAYVSGYKSYFTQEFLGNTTTIPAFNLYYSIPSYNIKPSFFFTVTGNDTTYTTVPSKDNDDTTLSGYSYAFRFISTSNAGTIKFNTDTVCEIIMLGGGGGGGRNASTQEGAGGGGAGGFNKFSFPMKNNITYSFTIGAGGAGKITSNGNGTNGGETKMSWTDTSSRSISVRGGGGGAGGNPSSGGNTGGSGGGGCGNSDSNPKGGSSNNTYIVEGGAISNSYTNNIINKGTNNIQVIGSHSSSFTSGEGGTTAWANAGGEGEVNGGGRRGRRYRSGRNSCYCW